MRGRALARNKLALLICPGVLADFQTLTHGSDIERFREAYIVDPRVREGLTHVSTYLIIQQSQNICGSQVPRSGLTSVQSLKIMIILH